MLFTVSSLILFQVSTTRCVKKYFRTFSLQCYLRMVRELPLRPVSMRSWKKSSRFTPSKLCIILNTSIKGALYRIQILCRRYTLWSYPAGLTIADAPGKQKLKYRRVYSHHSHTTIAESIHTTPNSVQCPFKSLLSRLISSERSFVFDSLKLYSSSPIPLIILVILL